MRGAGKSVDAVRMAVLDRLAAEGAEWTVDVVAELMEDGKERSAVDVSMELDRPRKTIQRALTSLSVENSAQQIHVCAKRGGRLIYVYGRGANVAQGGRVPGSTSPAAVEAREASAWWPEADDRVESAMRAMVSCGSTAIH